MSRYWTVEEHERFLEARKIYGRRDTKSIAEYVGTRTVTQVRTHTQKFEKRLELARRTGGPGFRVRSKKSNQHSWKSKLPGNIKARSEEDSCVSSTSSNVSMTKNEVESLGYHMDTQSPYSIQQTNIYPSNSVEGNPFELVDAEWCVDFLSFPSKSGETMHITATDTSTRQSSDYGKDISPYSATLPELYSNLPFWQSVIAKSSWRLLRDELVSKRLGDKKERWDSVGRCNVLDCNDSRLGKDEKVFDVENIESTEDLETALMEYFQRKPGVTCFDDTSSFSVSGSSTLSSFRM